MRVSVCQIKLHIWELVSNLKMGNHATKAFQSQTYPICVVIALSPALPVRAELNGTISSIDVDRDYVAGKVTANPRFGSTVYEITDRNGTIIREYASPAGRIFAISWEGRFMPEMKHFLGDLFEPYVSAMRSEHKTHNWRQPILIHTSNLTFENDGHMGWYYGRAYVESSVPGGFSIDDIR
jgi:hypothetical protein